MGAGKGLVTFEGLDHADGHPQASWLRQIEAHLRDMGMAGLASGRWPDVGRKSTDATWTRRRATPVYAPIPE